MKQTLCFLLALFASFVARADLAIYRQNLTVTTSDQNTKTARRITGYIVFELSQTNGGFGQIIASDTEKVFAVVTPQFQVRNVLLNAPRSQQIFKIQSDFTAGLTGKGVNSNREVEPGNVWTIPASYVLSGSDLYNEDAQWKFDEFRGTAIFDKTLTFSANGVNRDAQTELSALRGLYLTKGYTEIFP